MAITKLVLNGTEYDVGADGMGDVGYRNDGREITDDIYTWAQLKEKCTNNDFSDLKHGDYKWITMKDTGEKVCMEIAGIDTYYRTCDQEIGHHIDWISRDCLATTSKWNDTNNNNGDSTSPYPFLVSRLKSYLTDVYTNNIPDEVKAVISNKRFLLEQRYNANGAQTESTSWGWTNLGELWVPTEGEIFDSTVWTSLPYGNGHAVQYPLFVNSYKHRIKKLGTNGSRCSWWTLTPCAGSSTYCVRVNSNGIVAYDNTSYVLGVPVCFRIMA